MDVLVLQHIACEPPGVYEDALLRRGARITRVELDEGQRVPDRALGPGALPQLLGEFEGRASELMDHGRRMFESWFDAMVGVRT